MKLHYVEVRFGINHGKFIVGTFEAQDWNIPSAVDRANGHITSLLRRCGWGPEHFLMLDIQTGEGSIFRHGGLAAADLTKHQVWVCPMFEPFLVHLYRLSMDEIDALPPLVWLENAEEALRGYRRPGPINELLEAARAVLEDARPISDLDSTLLRLEEAIATIDRVEAPA